MWGRCFDPELADMIALISAFLMQTAQVMPVVETTPVPSADDAADDPALWYNSAAPGRSLILGTDKKSGLVIYDLKGEQRQLLPVGRLNNVDILHDVALADWQGDLAAGSNRSDDSVTLFSVSYAQTIQLGSFSVAPEPYGFCMGRDKGGVVLFVAHKQGYVQPYRLQSLAEPPLALPPLYLNSQIEGCVYDDYHQTFFVGEETKGIWAVPFKGGVFDRPNMTLVDVTGGSSGLTEDVEGITLYKQADGNGYLIVSSQGDDSYHLYERAGRRAFVGKFRIGINQADAIDGTQETDGIDVVSFNLGANFPKGLFMAQDGFNVLPDDLQNDGRTPDEEPLSAQNFKVVDWREIEKLIVNAQRQ